MAGAVARASPGDAQSQIAALLSVWDTKNDGVICINLMRAVLLKVQCSEDLVQVVLQSFRSGTAGIRYLDLLAWLFDDLPQRPSGEQAGKEEEEEVAAPLDEDGDQGHEEEDEDEGVEEEEAEEEETAADEPDYDGGSRDGQEREDLPSGAETMWARLTTFCLAWLARVPQLNLLRLMQEFRQVELAMGPSPPRDEGLPTRLLSCEPVDGSLLEWEVEMAFPPESGLQAGLEALRAKEALGSPAQPPPLAALAMRVRFPLDFPRTPPEVWVRWPRLAPAPAAASPRGPTAATFSGRICSETLSKGGWEPSLDVLSALWESEKAILEAGLQVASAPADLKGYPVPPRGLDRQATDQFGRANRFEKRGMRVLSAAAAAPFLGDVSRLEASDKIALPMGYLEEICRHQALESPAIFEVKSKLGRKRHCAVFDWMDGIPEMHAILPRWVMDDLGVEDHEPVRVRGVRLELASYVKVQPHTAAFYSAVASAGREVSELLTDSLAQCGALTEDTAVPIRVGGQTFALQVIELRPKAAVRIIDTDMENHFEFKVDFEPAPDLEDEAAVRERQERLLAERRAKEARLAARRRRREDREGAAARRRFEKARAEVLPEGASEHPDDGTEGEVEVSLRLPDGSQARGRFREGAPLAVVLAFALRSAWAERTLPLCTGLRERAPPRRVLQPSEPITRALHRSVVVVEVLTPRSGAAADVEASSSSEAEAPAAPPPLPAEPAPRQHVPLLARDVDALQRRTLEAFEAQRFLRAGLEPEEAERRARSGEEAPLPPLSGARPRPPAHRAGPRRPRPRPPQLQRTASEEERRQQAVEEVVAITGVSHGAALRALEAWGFDAERAVNQLLDVMAAGGVDYEPEGGGEDEDAAASPRHSEAAETDDGASEG